MINADKLLFYYDSLFPASQEQIELINNLCLKAEHPKLLSMECGKALVCKPLAGKGIDVTLTDSIPEFTDFLNSSSISREDLFHSFNILPGDLARYLAKAYFNVITCNNFRLLLVPDKTFLLKLFTDTKALLKPDGCFLFELPDFGSIDFTKGNIRLPDIAFKGGNYSSVLTQDEETAGYLLSSTITTDSGEKIPVAENEPAYPASITAVKQCAQEAGFTRVNFYSDWKLSEYKPGGSKVICMLNR